MEEIKVGEYFRTKQGYIHKVKSVHKDMIWWCDLDWIPEKDITKHSSNIIDLIEEGDYVNGEQIDFINISKEGKKRPLIRDNIYFFDKYNSIKSIVTKEMFNQVKYEV